MENDAAFEENPRSSHMYQHGSRNLTFPANAPRLTTPEQRPRSAPAATTSNATREFWNRFPPHPDATLPRARADNHLERSDLRRPVSNGIPNVNVLSTRNSAPFPPFRRRVGVAFEGSKLQPNWRRHLPFVIIYLVTFVWVALEACFAFFSTSRKPRLLFPEPGETILLLNIGSTISIILLGELATETFDNVRWHLAANLKGVGFTTFLGLGRVTNIYGVIRLFWSRGTIGHRMWLLQR